MLLPLLFYQILVLVYNVAGGCILIKLIEKCSVLLLLSKIKDRISFKVIMYKLYYRILMYVPS